MLPVCWNSIPLATATFLLINKWINIKNRVKEQMNTKKRHKVILIYLNMLYRYFRDCWIYLNMLYRYLRDCWIYLNMLYRYLRDCWIYLNMLYRYLRNCWIYLNMLYRYLRNCWIYLNVLYRYNGLLNIFERVVQI